MNEFDRISQGVLGTSRLHYALHSDFAEAALFYPQHVGVFDCNSDYFVNRRHWNSFLLIFVDSGQLDVFYRGESRSAVAGDVVFLDCKEPHQYSSNPQVSFHHIHFLGNASQHYFDLLYEIGGCVLYPAVRRTMDGMFSELLHQMTAPIQNEHVVSVCIHTILADLTIACQPKMLEYEETVSQAMDIIEQQYPEDLPIARIAAQLNLSESYLSHIFKANTGLTLHQYLLNVRIQQAQRLLVTSGDSLEEISAKCGYRSVTHFIRAFKKQSGTTPGKFRRLPL